MNLPPLRSIALRLIILDLRQCKVLLELVHLHTVDVTQLRIFIGLVACEKERHTAENIENDGL